VVAEGAKSLIQAADGYRLEVATYASSLHSVPPCVAIINSGAGIPKAFYEPFASWLARQGIPTITYDYRGIGGSRGKSLRNFPAAISDWGSKDCAAVLNYAYRLYPTAQIQVVGHSIGGIVTGFVSSDAPRIHRLLFISPHTGYVGDYASGSRLKMFILWHLSMPVVTRLMGYFPGRAFGLPEDLPARVALEWGRRRFRGSITSDASYGSCSHINANALALRPSDDLFATESAVRRVEKRFSSVRFTDLVLDVSSTTDRRLGHFGFFRPSSREKWWPVAQTWLQDGIIGARQEP
jgi:predicted alpha/beta hydrolase